MYASLASVTSTTNQAHMVALENRKQCIAITKKGQRCKLYALPREKVCHVHINQKQATSHDTVNSKIKSTSQVTTSNKLEGYKLFNSIPKKNKRESHSPDKKLEKRGNIYVFTYAHMMLTRPTQSQSLNLAEPTDNNWIDYNKVSPFNTSNEILIKVGYTSKKPETRIKEWREQCGHSEFILLYPGCLVPVYKNEKEKRTMKKLEKMFKNLKIGSKSEKETLNEAVMSKGEHTRKRYKNLNQERTCFVSSSAYQSEQKIHKILRERYGSGKMYCEGCARHKNNDNNRMIKTVSVHTEWFMIPRNEMGVIWDIIESQCHMIEANK